MATNRETAEPSSRPWEWLYSLTGLGMWSFIHARFDVEILGPFPRVTRRDLWIATHREETDVPLLAGLMYTRGGMWRPAAARVHFAARDDLFEPGIVAAKLRLPGRAARLAWPLSPGPWLPRVRAHPVRRPTGAKLGQLLAVAPDEARLGQILGDRVLVLIGDRARRLRQPSPDTVEAVRRPEYGPVLWEDVGAEDMVAPLGVELWRRHIGRAAGDLRRLVQVVRRGDPLLLFPEGRVSPDGALGPVGEILGVVTRRGRPGRIIPIAVAYDPLCRGRTTVAVGIGAPCPVDAPDLPAAAHLRLRQAMPVTCGQITARFLLEAAQRGRTRIDVPELERRLGDAVASAAADGRPIAQGLTAEAARRRRLASALEWAAARRIVARHGAVVSIDAAGVLGNRVVMRLAREDASLSCTHQPAGPLPAGRSTPGERPPGAPEHE